MTLVKILVLSLLGLTAAIPTAVTRSHSVMPQAPIIVNHNSVALFEQIPESYLIAAQNTPMLYMDRSVGGNISEGLDCLNYPTDEQALNHCRRYIHPDPNFSVSPDQINWSRPGGYVRANWDFVFWPYGCSSWSEETGCFFDYMDSHPGEYKVASYQFSYLEVQPGSDIANQPGGYFSDSSRKLDVYDLEDFEAAHPELTVIYWTTSLARSIGSPESEIFNNQMRAYAMSHGKPLFDVADILSHDPYGNPCYDNRDGVPYNIGTASENYPDDGLNTPAICQYYTTESDGGHLGTISVGKIRVAKAFWVLMAQLAGWNPGVPPPATFTPTFTRSFTPTATRPAPVGDDRVYLPMLRR
jgi:hypothetical protein